MKPGGLLLLNSSLIDREVRRDDITAVAIPATEIASELGNVRVTNMVALGALVQLTGIVSFSTLEEVLKKVLPEHRHKLIPLNLEAIERGAQEVKA